MPAKSKRSKAATAKRQKTTGKFCIAAREETGSEWEEEESEDGGLTDVSDDETPYATMQRRFAEHFGKILEKKDIKKDDGNINKVCVFSYMIYCTHSYHLFNRRKQERKEPEILSTVGTRRPQCGGRIKKLQNERKVLISYLIIALQK